MNILYVMVPIAILLGISFLVAFIWGVKNGQFDDLETPSHRILIPEAKNNDLTHSLVHSKEK